MEKMNTEELVEIIAKENGMSKVGAKEALSAVCAGIVSALTDSDAEKIRVGSLGTINVKTVPAHTGINPATLESVEIPEKFRVSFKFSKAVKDAINA